MFWGSKRSDFGTSDMVFIVFRYLKLRLFSKSWETISEAMTNVLGLGTDFGTLDRFSDLFPGETSDVWV